MAVATILPHGALSSPRVQPTQDEITDLAQDLMHDEPCMQFLEASIHAVQLLDELEAYAAVWDSMAFFAGNDEAMHF